MILTSDYIKEAFCINFKVASIRFTYLNKMSLNNPFWGLKSNSKVATKVLIKASNLEGVKYTQAFSKVVLIWHFCIVMAWYYIYFYHLGIQIHINWGHSFSTQLPNWHLLILDENKQVFNSFPIFFLTRLLENNSF